MHLFQSPANPLQPQNFHKDKLIRRDYETTFYPFRVTELLIIPAAGDKGPLYFFSAQPLKRVTHDQQLLAAVALPQWDVPTLFMRSSQSWVSSWFSRVLRSKESCSDMIFISAFFSRAAILVISCSLHFRMLSNSSLAL